MFYDLLSVTYVRIYETISTIINTPMILLPSYLIFKFLVYIKSFHTVIVP